MFAVLLENIKMDTLSLSNECLLVSRAIMYMVQIFKDCKHSLTNPTKGLGLEHLLELARDKEHYVALTMDVQNMPLIWWTSFYGIMMLENHLVCFIVPLLHYSDTNQPNK